MALGRAGIVGVLELGVADRVGRDDGPASACVREGGGGRRQAAPAAPTGRRRACARSAASAARRDGGKALRDAAEGALGGQADAPLLDQGAARGARGGHKPAGSWGTPSRRAGDQCGL
eukprot:9082248-Alexandrium_andersonii.AAC.1